MADPSEKAKTEIDSLSKEQMLYEFHKGTSSRYQSANFAYMNTRLAILQEQEDEDCQQEVLNVAKLESDVAEQSNHISKEALEIAKEAKILSVLAILISIITIIVLMYYSN